MFLPLCAETLSLKVSVRLAVVATSPVVSLDSVRGVVLMVRSWFVVRTTLPAASSRRAVMVKLPLFRLLKTALHWLLLTVTYCVVPLMTTAMCAPLPASLVPLTVMSPVSVLKLPLTPLSGEMPVMTTVLLARSSEEPSALLAAELSMLSATSLAFLMTVPVSLPALTMAACKVWLPASWLGKL